VQGGVRAVEVVVVEEEREAGGAVVGGFIGTAVGPFAGDGLDEAFGLAIGLRAIRNRLHYPMLTVRFSSSKLSGTPAEIASSCFSTAVIGVRRHETITSNRC